MILMPNYSRHPVSATDFGFIIIQSLRLTLLIVLILLYMVPCSESTAFAASDPERQPLLGKILRSKATITRFATDGNTYRTNPSQTDSQATDATKSNDSVTEDPWIMKERKAKEMIMKRLKQDGNWVTYIKGFSVRQTRAYKVYCNCSFALGISSIRMADWQQDTSVSSCPCWRMPTWLKCP